ncbi:hypothetical protein Y032_0150g2753 [Ancylostoma ceylanicum]|uniref:Uncharacterized protein n=1 Tax=Ancylostoma ceylanicum TaxID=53326 RepID=A0A016T176_9BILA|nr:hypothetical protein Y032_0150g2753 [Ancylostoma ceylanicum]
MICQYFVDDDGAYSYRCRQEGTLFYFHRYFLVGKPAANIALATELALLTIFWLCTAYMRREFTKIFTSVTVFPMTVRAGLVALHTAVILAMDFPNMKLVHGLRTAELILETTTCFSFMLDSLIFTGTAIHIARVRTAPKGLVAISVVHVTVVALVCSLSILDAFPPQFGRFSYSSLSPLIFLGLLGGSAAVMICLFIAALVLGAVHTCCSKDSRSVNSNDPVVFNAISRMCWAIPLMLIAGIAALIDYAGHLSYDPYLSTLSTALLPPCILLTLFLVVPAYRTALFCCCANNRLRNKVVPITSTLRPSSSGAAVGSPANPKESLVPVVC